jgi:hypothetical protein
LQLTQTIPAILRPANSALPLRARDVLPLVTIAAALYGTAIGSFGGLGPAGRLQMLFSAIKLPMLLGISFVLTVPSFFMLHTLLGLGSDFRFALRAAATAQAGVAVTLAALSPFVPLFYASCSNYAWAILFNGGMFAIATASGQILLRRFYQRLIRSNPRHRMVLRAWVVAYAFIAIQMAWVLRPFIGERGQPTTFFRPGAWGNAYLVVWDMFWNAMR